MKPIKIMMTLARTFLGTPRRTYQNLTATKSVALIRGTRQTKRMRLKLKRSGKVVSEIIPIVPAGIKMKLMHNAARRQQLVELLVALIEPKFIIGAAIEINLQSCRPRLILHNRKRTFVYPERRIQWGAERLPQHLSHRPG